MAKPKAPSGEMPFLDHLEELRWRLIYSLGAVVAGMGLGFFLVLRYDLLLHLQKPLMPYLQGQRLVYTHPGDPFSVLLQMAFVVAIAVALPVILYNVWAFLSPALYRHEKRVVLPVLAVGSLLFIGGVALAYFLVLPLTLRFLFGLQAEALTPMITVSDYFGFMVGMCVAFGAVFEAPLIIVALSALGIVSAAMLGRFRRYAVVLVWVAAAIVTPGDLFTTTLALAIPLYLLYEVSILVAILIERRRKRRQAAEAREAVA